MNTATGTIPIWTAENEKERQEWRWNTLKQRLDNYNAKIHCENNGPCTGEFRAGFDRALDWVDSEIEKLVASPEVEKP